PPCAAERPDGIEYVARLDGARRGLREHRGEEEEVAVADQRDVHGQHARAPARELERRGHASEASSEDDDSRRKGGRWSGQDTADGRAPGGTHRHRAETTLLQALL